jgi:hypothetical protein
MNSSDFRLRLVVTAAMMSCLPATASAAAAALPLPPFEESAERKLAYDWVQIDSGEWLKGEIKRLLDEELYFDSDEFDDVSFDWDNSYKLNLVVTDISETNHHAESVLSFDVWGPLDLKLSLIFDRIEEPVPNSDGVRPESNDLRLTAGLGLSF